MHCFNGINQSRVLPLRVGSSDTPANTIISIFNLGANLGNPRFYPWLEEAGLTTPDDIETFFAQALLDALANQVTGSNAETGLVDPLTGRANLNLIQNNGISLHQFLEDNFQVVDLYSTLNNQGDLKYVERDCHGNLIHNQTVNMMGYSNLLTNDVVDVQNQVTVQPHATDMNIYFRGNFDTDEISVDIKKCH